MPGLTAVIWLACHQHAFRDPVHLLRWNVDSLLEPIRSRERKKHSQRRKIVRLDVWKINDARRNWPDAASVGHAMPGNCCEEISHVEASLDNERTTSEQRRHHHQDHAGVVDERKGPQG